MTSEPRHPPNPGVTSYRDLVVWQKAVDHCVAIYRLCQTLPRDERFVLGAQLRRASVSVACNIAEGHARSHTGEFLQQLSVARGSLAEVETQLTIGCRVDFFTEHQARGLLQASDEISRMLAGLTARLRQRQASSRKPRNPGRLR
jgi:four helix bundle protein